MSDLWDHLSLKIDYVDVYENNGVPSLIKQRRNYDLAIWLGLFAMLMIHVGPLISGTQALVINNHSWPVESANASTDLQLYERATPATIPLTSDSKQHQHVALLDAETLGSEAHSDHALDYHAMMGHQPAPVGAPQWLANLEMCGYCDLLTVSPPLVLALLLALPVPPLVQYLAVLPVPPRPLAAAHSQSHPRAPPVHLFA